VAIAAAVKVIVAEAIAAAAPQQRKALPTELREERWKVRDDQRSEASGRSGQRYDRMVWEAVFVTAKEQGREDPALPTNRQLGGSSRKRRARARASASVGWLEGTAGEWRGLEVRMASTVAVSRAKSTAQRQSRLESSIILRSRRTASSSSDRIRSRASESTVRYICPVM
jgi:hypothetical protein